MNISQRGKAPYLQILLLVAAGMLLRALLRCDLGSPGAVGRAADGHGCFCPHPWWKLSQCSLLHGSRQQLLPCRDE